MGREDPALEAFLDQLGDPADVVDVGMGQDERVDGGRIEIERGGLSYTVDTLATIAARERP